MPGFNCNTCRLIFDSVDAVKVHYAEAIHAFNSKRRTKGLPPATPNEFEQLNIATKGAVKPLENILQNVPQKSAASQPSKSNKQYVLNTADATNYSRNKPLETEIKVEEIKKEDVKEIKKEEVEKKEENETSNEENENDDNEDDENWETDDEEGGGDDGENEIGDLKDLKNKNIVPLPLGVNIGIFDNKKFNNVDECLKHMIGTNGFFLPDVEYISDLNGLLLYLGEKVKVGAICLYCQRKFASGRACQHHMLEKSHCKLTYEDDIDMDEYEDFYDFSKSYEDGSDEGSDEESDEIAEIDNVTGELVLPNGKVLGNRKLKLYYKQYYSNIEQRESVLLLKREELLKLGNKYNNGETNVNYNSEVVNKMSDVEVQENLIKHYKMIRKNDILEQKGMMKKVQMDQKKEYKSKIQAARSSQTTTAKIRDYHKSVM